MPVAHSLGKLSRPIVSMDNGFCVSSLTSAMRRYGKPDIFNTDQGVQFTDKAFTGVLKDNGIRISMNGKGLWMERHPPTYTLAQQRP